MKNNKFAILVLSFDGFSDLWSPLNENFKKYVDERIPSFLISNQLDYELSNISCIKVGEDISWTSNLRKALDSLESYEYVFLAFDDVFFASKIKYDELEQYCSEMNRLQCVYLSLLNRPGTSLIKINEDFSVIHSKSFYPVSAGLCIWKKKDLISYLQDNRSAWEYEDMFKLNKKKKKYMSLNNDYFTWIHLVVKGKVYPKAEKDLLAEGIEIARNRERYTGYEEIIHSVRDYFRDIFVRLISALYLGSYLRNLKDILNK